MLLARSIRWNACLIPPGSVGFCRMSLPRPGFAFSVDACIFVRILYGCLFDVLPFCGYPHVTAEVRWH